MSRQFDPEKSWVHLHFMTQFMRVTLRQFMDSGISLTKACVLVELGVLSAAGKAPTIADLAKATGLTRSVLSRNISELLSAGYIVEEIDPNDRRQRVFRLSCSDEYKPFQDYVNIALAQIEEYLGDEGDDELRRLADLQMKLHPELAGTLHEHPAEIVYKHQEVISQSE